MIGLFFGWIPGLAAGSIVGMLWVFGWAPMIVVGLAALAIYLENLTPR